MQQDPMISGNRLEEDFEAEQIRPSSLEDYIGQTRLKEKLRVYIDAARSRGEPLDHCLFYGPPGLGKTSLAYIIAREMGTEMTATRGPAIEKAGDLAAILTGLQKGAILFIDEIHRLPRIVEEHLYSAMEDFELDIIIGTGPGARTIKLPLQPFTLVGATTRYGLLTSPLRDRFGITERLEFYPPEELAVILQRAARIWRVPLTEDGAREIGRRARGTPRVANRLLRRLRDFVEQQHSGALDQGQAARYLELLEVDELGLDRTTRHLLLLLLDKFGGGPVGLETLAAALSEEKDTIEDVFEPFLLQSGLLMKTPRGRVATELCYRHLGRLPPDGMRQLSLLG
jgi:Holliday junction DNA helicase RuvB